MHPKPTQDTDQLRTAHISNLSHYQSPNSHSTTFRPAYPHLTPTRNPPPAPCTHPPPPRGRRRTSGLQWGCSSYREDSRRAVFNGRTRAAFGQVFAGRARSVERRAGNLDYRDVEAFMSHGCVFCGCLMDAEMEAFGEGGARGCFDFDVGGFV